MISRTFEILEYSLKNHPREDILAGKKNGKWKKYSTKDYYKYSILAGIGLLALGLKKGDKIATISVNNHPEWNFIDMAMSMTGVIHVPVYPSLSQDDFKFIFNQSQIKYVFVTDEKTYETIRPVLDHTPFVLSVFGFNQINGTIYWKKIINLGKENKAKYEGELDKQKKTIKPDDPVTLIYTSGTTGKPKGVLLSHHNLVSNILASSDLHPLRYKDKVISFLPLSHIYERTSNYQFQYSGIGIYYAEGITAIIENLKEIRPEGFTTVPRLLEKIRSSHLNQGQNLKGLKKSIFLLSNKLALVYPNDHNLTLTFRIKRLISYVLVFRRLRNALGGRIKFIGCGGARLNPEVEKFFWTAGLPVYQGYGLTETSPLISLNRLPLSKCKIGTVGPVVPGVKVKIKEDGEILCKGSNVMIEYFREPDLTKKVIDEEGWFHTGDIGELTRDQFLIIRGRKKHLFKTSYGKYIAPQVIESRFSESQIISQLMVVGESEKFVGALILPNFEQLYKLVKSSRGLKTFDKIKLTQLPETQSLRQSEINKINKSLGLNEQIKKFQIISDDWSVSTGEISPSLKLRRDFISRKYQHLIRLFYND